MRYGATPTKLLERIAFLSNAVPVPILDVLVGPIQARALLVAQKVGALDALAEGPQTTEALAARLRVDAECLGLVLRVLRAMRYVDLAEGNFSLSSLGQAFFGPKAREPLGAFLEYGDAQWRMLDQLEQVLRSGKGVDFHATHTPDEWESYQRAMREVAADFAWFVAEKLPVPAGARACLDLAGAHGLVGAKLCERHPGMRSTVFDLPVALKTSQPLAETGGYADRVTFREGNLLTDSYGENFDVALLCNILHHFRAETNVAILEKAHAALRPGGTIGIFDIEVPEATAPPEAAGDAFALYFRLTSTAGCFRAADYEDWLRQAGFRSPRTVRSVKMPSRMLVVAKRP